MSRDWNIVDEDEPAAVNGAVNAAADESRLDLDRVRTIARGRRAATRMQQWHSALIAFFFVISGILIMRAIGWVRTQEHPRAGIAAIVIGAGMLTSAIALIVRSRSD